MFSKEEFIRQTAKNLEIRLLSLYESEDGAAGELHIRVNGKIDHYMMDVVIFNENGNNSAIRSDTGRDG